MKRWSPKQRINNPGWGVPRSVVRVVDSGRRVTVDVVLDCGHVVTCPRRLVEIAEKNGERCKRCRDQ